MCSLHNISSRELLNELYDINQEDIQVKARTTNKSIMQTSISSLFIMPNGLCHNINLDFKHGIRDITIDLTKFRNTAFVYLFFLFLQKTWSPFSFDTHRVLIKYHVWTLSCDRHAIWRALRKDQCSQTDSKGKLRKASANTDGTSKKTQN